MLYSSTRDALLSIILRLQQAYKFESGCATTPIAERRAERRAILFRTFASSQLSTFD